MHINPLEDRELKVVKKIFTIIHVKQRDVKKIFIIIHGNQKDVKNIFIIIHGKHTVTALSKTLLHKNICEILQSCRKPKTKHTILLDTASRYA
jgi:hypothetical protein